MAFAVDRWVGPDKLVIAFDFGTTQSSVSYSCLIENGIQSTQRVLSWPGSHQGEAKVPTAIWYDHSGKCQMYGFEAVSQQGRVTGEDHNWFLVQNFKLHLHPSQMQEPLRITLPNLPETKTIMDIVVDWLKYLYQHTEHFFCEKEGADLWNRLKPVTEFVFTYPDGWGPEEVSRLQGAATKANIGLEHSQVHFVTEAEASIHFLIAHAGIPERLQRDTSFIVCNSGASTVGTTLYTVTEPGPMVELTERRSSSSVRAGGLGVTQAAEEFIRRRLSSCFSEEELQGYVSEATHDFEHIVKRRFQGNETQFSLKIGDISKTEPSIHLQSGQLVVDGTKVEEFFVPSADEIVKSVVQQMRQSLSVSCVLLLGGFGDSPYLQMRLRRKLGTIPLTIADRTDADPISDGAIIWHIQRPRPIFGTTRSRLFDPHNPKHQGRRLQRRKDGQAVSDAWIPIASRDHLLEQTDPTELRLWSYYETRRVDLSQLQVPIYTFVPRNTISPPFVKDTDGNLLEGFMEIGTVSADMNEMRKRMKAKWTWRGRSWRLYYTVALSVQGSDLVAWLAWRDTSGQLQKGPETRVPLKLKIKQIKS